MNWLSGNTISWLNGELAEQPLLGVRLRADRVTVYPAPGGAERLLLLDDRWWLLVRDGRGQLLTEQQASRWLWRHQIRPADIWPCPSAGRLLRDGYDVVAEVNYSDPDWDEGAIEESLLRTRDGSLVLASRTVEPEDLLYPEPAVECWPNLTEVTATEAQQWCNEHGVKQPSPVAGGCPLAVAADGTLRLEGRVIGKSGKKSAAVLRYIIDQYPRDVPTKELKEHFKKVGDPGKLLHNLLEIEALQTTLIPPGGCHSGRGWLIIPPLP